MTTSDTTHTLGRDWFVQARPRVHHLALTHHGTVALREISVADRLELERCAKGAVDRSVARLVQMSMIDDSGRTLFTPEDLETIERMPASIVLPIFHAACRLNGIGEPEPEKK